MSGQVIAAGAGVRFFFDAQQRPVTRAFARLRMGCTSSWGLRGVDLDAGPGESVALLGPNGAGKTTLLRILAGVYPPDEGRVDVRGRIGSLLSVESGLMPRLTGRENALLLGVLAGLSRRRALALLDDVRERSGLHDAYERPTLAYSEGMRARLGFTVIELARPSVLLFDEVHEALDHDFHARLEGVARATLGAGGVVVAAGHDHAVLERLCRSAVLLDGGRVRARGPIAAVAARYRSGPVGRGAS